MEENVREQSDEVEMTQQLVGLGDEVIVGQRKFEATELRRCATFRVIFLTSNEEVVVVVLRFSGQRRVRIFSRSGGRLSYSK